ncbi:sugar-specific transcriptional regulator TrmB [Dysgonomonas sp. PH5-45]|uniref:hypothetical protein n=1 Tax=unclassified Dysgonomonas TaxID=2630389 RepID=UPI0024743A46|nr:MULTISPECIES: hypothetical protein [unclassified Dysgonomonas]MDH6354672.1 sugar-specific transcriptional regulator TrmB [Dysgonomonas sp. PH5-45]MDH6387569.1 sugar-specific transcriptional regulator TrmB [Dysgonomonas sp. PH5-37]
MAKNDIAIISEMFEEFKQTLNEISSKVDAMHNEDEANQPDPEYMRLIERSKETGNKVDDLFHFIRHEVKECQGEVEKRIKEQTTKLVGSQKETEEALRKLSLVKDTFAISFKSIKTLTILLSTIVLLLCSIHTNISQYKEKCLLQDSDLKYRYIKLQNGISEKELLELEDLFNDSKNTDLLKKLKNSIEEREKKIK